jgi:hypothetical protein
VSQSGQICLYESGVVLPVTRPRSGQEERAPGQEPRRSPVAQGLRARYQLEAARAEPVAECLRLARRHPHDRAYRDWPVRGGPVERTVSIPVPAPAVGAHSGYPKARVREPVPPGQLFRAWPTVAHGLAHMVRLRSQSGIGMNAEDLGTVAAFVSDVAAQIAPTEGQAIEAAATG